MPLTAGTEESRHFNMPDGQNIEYMRRHCARYNTQRTVLVKRGELNNHASTATDDLSTWSPMLLAVQLPRQSSSLYLRAIL